MRAWVAVLGLALAGCVEGTAPQTRAIERQIELPEGYPPKIGTATSDLSGVARVWDMYDYSIGAYDAAVQVYDYNGQATFGLTGEPVGKPQSKGERLRVKANMASQTQTGALSAAVVEVIAGEDSDGVRLTSVGSQATVVLDSLTPMGSQGAYGHVTGHYSAVLCAATGQPPKVDKAQCQPISGTFTSDLQIGGP